MKKKTVKTTLNRSAPDPKEEPSSEDLLMGNKTSNNPAGATSSTVMLEEFEILLEAIKAGHLDARADLGRASGADREMLEGINDMLDAVIGPLNVAAEYVDRISKGDIPENITDEYKGDFNEVKNNLNVCIDALNGMTGEMGMLAEAGVEGKLDTRGDASKFGGDFGKMVQGVNDTLDAIIGPLNVAAEYIDRISKGDIPENISDEYKGDFNEVKNNLNVCIDALNGLTSEMGMMAEAGVEGKLDTRGDAAKFGGDFGKMVQGVNDTLDAIIGPLNVAAEYIDRISKGDIPENITDEYKGDFNEVKNNLNVCIDALNGMTGEMGMLAEAGVEGKLDTRGDASKFGGDFGKMVQGVNDTLDAIIGPLNMMAEYVDRISKGDIPENISDEYKGDFNEVKNNLNVCIDAINGLTSEMGMMAEAGVEGKLDTRGDASKFGGDFGKMVQGVNDTLDAIIGPLNVAAEYIDRISKGDIPENISDEYKGDFNEVKNNLNVCIDAINGLTGEMGMLAEAGVEGKLDTRGDASKFGGDFGKMVQGVNDTLDAIIGPLNVAAEYIDRISKGDIPENITDEYKGDFNEVKNNLNVCIDALNGMTGEMGMLAEAGVEGKLDTRGDASKFGGDFGKMVQGVNDTLDAIIGPLNMMAEYVDRISKGDIPENISDEYKGDFNEVKNNLNVCIDAINGLTSEMGMMAEAGVEGKLDTRGDASKFGGDFGKMVQGVNDTLDAIIGPLNVAAEYIDRISKGDIPENITDEYKGDFNEVKNNLNVCIDALNGMTGEMGMLAGAAVEGRLDTRGDAEKFGGDFGKIVQGVNDTLDAVVVPINEAMEVLEGVANRDLTKEIVGDYKGKLKDFKENTNSAIKNLHDALSQVGTAAEQVGSASGQVASSGQQLAEGSSEQASSLEETSSSLEEMSSMTNQNADNSKQANSLMGEANQIIVKANVSMKNLTTSMEDITKASEETSKIVKTIDEIAFQTNLLALNAAVEAARAGEAGAGFAVVAEEVRNLALRSADAAKNTAGLIEDTVNKVKDGANIVSVTNEAFTEVATSASKVGDLVGEIAGASNEQAQGIEQVNTAIAEMDKVTQQNAANAEESAAAAEEMSAQAQELNSMVAEFKLNGQHSGRKQMITPKRQAGNFKQTALLTTKAKTGKIVNPETVIPMDDDNMKMDKSDFKDF